MSNLLPPRLPIDRSAIEGIKTVDDVKQWLRNYVTALDKQYAKQLDTINNFGMSTTNWDVREATAADVTNGDAAAVGNLISIHRTTGTTNEEEV